MSTETRRNGLSSGFTLGTRYRINTKPEPSSAMATKKTNERDILDIPVLPAGYDRMTV